MTNACSVARGASTTIVGCEMLKRMPVEVLRRVRVIGVPSKANPADGFSRNDGNMPKQRQLQQWLKLTESTCRWVRDSMLQGKDSPFTGRRIEFNPDGSMRHSEAFKTKEVSTEDAAQHEEGAAEDQLPFICLDEEGFDQYISTMEVEEEGEVAPLGRHALGNELVGGLGASLLHKRNREQ